MHAAQYGVLLVFFAQNRLSRLLMRKHEYMLRTEIFNENWKIDMKIE